MTPRWQSLQDELQQSRPFRSRREELFLALLRTAAVVRRPVAKVVEDHGLSLALYNVLRILRGAGAEGLPTLAIRERMIEEAAGITRLIDKLEASGFVRRERDASDRRQVYCRITEAGTRLLVDVDPHLVSAIDTALSHVEGGEQDGLLALLAEVRAGACPPKTNSSQGA